MTVHLYVPCGECGVDHYGHLPFCSQYIADDDDPAGLHLAQVAARERREVAIRWDDEVERATAARLDAELRLGRAEAAERVLVDDGQPRGDAMTIHLYARPLARVGKSDIGPRTETWCGDDVPDERCSPHIGKVTCRECLAIIMAEGARAESRAKKLQLDFTQPCDQLESLSRKASELGVDVPALHRIFGDAVGVLADNVWGHGAPDYMWMVVALLPPLWRQEIGLRLEQAARPADPRRLTLLPGNWMRLSDAMVDHLRLQVGDVVVAGLRDGNRVELQSLDDWCGQP